MLELPAIAALWGLSPVCVNNFPDALAAIIIKHIANSNTAVGAAMKGDRNLFAEAVLMGGYITDRAKVIKMVDEQIMAQNRYLPQFN